jgi:hypothetical protein
LLVRLEAYSDSAHCRQKAKTIEAFFSETARDHHAEEERNVFPNLLLSGNAELVQAVLTLKQDHGWIEQNWLELAPMRKARIGLTLLNSSITLRCFCRYVTITSCWKKP